MTEFTSEWIAGAREVVGNDDASPSGQIAFIALDHIEHLQKRIAELEAQQRWIHQDKTMIVKKDGDSWCFVLPDFINLQESEAKFMDAVLSSFIDRIYTNLLPQPPKDGE